MTYDEIISKLKKREFAPVYLLMGDEPFYIDAVTSYIEEHVLDAADRDFNQVTLYGKDVDAAEVIANAKEFPFGCDYRVVIVKEAKGLKDFEKLKSYVEKPSANSILVIAYKYDKLKATQTKPYNQNGVVFTSEKIRDYEVAKWVQKQATVHQFKISQMAADILAEHIGNDLTRIDNELKKLQIILPTGSEITPEIIEKNIGISKEYNILELQNALGERNIPKVYKIIFNFCKNLKENPNMVTIASLYKFYHKLLSCHYSFDKSDVAMAKIFGTSHPYALKINRAAAQRYSVIELKKIIGVLREFDMRAKGVNNNASEEEVLKELIYRILH